MPAGVTGPRSNLTSHRALRWWQQTTPQALAVIHQLWCGQRLPPRAGWHEQVGLPLTPLHPTRVPKGLLPQGSWHGRTEPICGTTARVRAHKACSQHGQTAPRFSGRSHFQYIFNMALTSTWPTPIKRFVGYMTQTQGTHCFRKQNLLLSSPPTAQKTPG